MRKAKHKHYKSAFNISNNKKEKRNATFYCDKGPHMWWNNFWGNSSGCYFYEPLWQLWGRTAASASLDLTLLGLCHLVQCATTNLYPFFHPPSSIFIYFIYFYPFSCISSTSIHFHTLVHFHHFLLISSTNIHFYQISTSVIHFHPIS